MSKLLLESRQGKEFNKVLKNVKGYEESFAERKIYVSYEDGRESEEYSMMQYMASPIIE